MTEGQSLPARILTGLMAFLCKFVRRLLGANESFFHNGFRLRTLGRGLSFRNSACFDTRTTTEAVGGFEAGSWDMIVHTGQYAFMTSGPSRKRIDFLCCVHRP